MQRDSNMFGNHFHILYARMVQSMESAWTACPVLEGGGVDPPPTKIFFFRKIFKIQHALPLNTGSNDYLKKEK